jgi:uncharacterized MAPEG superfamily protein
MHEWFRAREMVVFVISCSILCVEMAAFAVATALTRQKRNLWLNQEDAQRFSGDVADIEHRDVARLLRVHRNLLENFVPFFALGSLWLATGAAQGFGTALFVAFTLARIVHPIFYLARMGRLRTATFTIGVGVLLILAWGTVWSAIGSLVQPS